MCMMKHINNIRAVKKYSSVREDRIRAFLKITIKVNYIVPKQKSYKIENPFSMWGWINARKLHPLCKGIEI